MADEQEPTPTTTEQAPVEPAASEPQGDPAAVSAPVGEAEVTAMRAALKKANKEAETHRLKLKEIEDRDLSELDKARNTATEATAKVATYERTNLLQRVALTEGVPADLVDRLRGDTEDEVTADAKALMARFITPATPSPLPLPSQGPRPISAITEADAEYERFYPSNRK